MTTGPRLEVSRSHDGYVLISDAADAMGLRWRLDLKAAHDLIGQLSQALVRHQETCQGTVATAPTGIRVTFEWPLARVDHAIQDLRDNIVALMGAR